MSVQRSSVPNFQNSNQTTASSNPNAPGGPSNAPQRPPSVSPGTSPGGTPAGSPALPPRDLDDYNRGAMTRRPYGQSPYSSYGGYGSRYGGYGGPSPYSRYGGGGYPQQRYQSPNGMGGKMGYNDQGMGSIQYFQSLIDTFARFAELLSMNAEAVHGSFSSVMGLLEIFSHLKREIGIVLSSIAIVRWISKHIAAFLGIKRKTRIETEKYVEEFSKVDTGFPWSSVGFLVISAFALSVMIRALRKFSDTFDEDEEEVKEEVVETKALYDYRAERRGDLQFRKGDTIKILDKTGVWWVGELTSGPNKGLKGEFPANYVENGIMLEERSPENRNTGSSFQRSGSFQRPGDRRYSNYPSQYGYNDYYANEYPPEIW